MTQDAIGNWVEKARSSSDDSSSDNSGSGSRVKVIRREEVMSKGNMIMDIAERIRPFLMKLFQGLRDEAGMLYQPAHVRGIALNMAQDLLKRHEENESKK